jgi:hypothetical protein
MKNKTPLIALVAKTLGSILLACIAFVVFSIMWFTAGRSSDFAAQRKRMSELRSSPAAASASLAADLAIPDNASLASLRYLATHNSYRRSSDPLRLFFIGLVEPEWPEKLAYSHPSPTTQLESGLRSFEFDIRPRKDGFVLAHVPLVDDRSDIPDFGLALEEIALWSDRNPGHVPLILLLELKEDYSFLDPALGRWDVEAFDRLDKALRRGLGGKLFAPDELRGGAASLSSALARRGWPSVGETRGRILVILHQNETYRRIYTEGRPSLEGRAMFDCAPPGSPDEAVAILNDPIGDSVEIAELSAKDILVRTRADSDLKHSSDMLAAALASGARIISTDYPPGRPASDGYAASLPGGKMFDIVSKAVGGRTRTTGQ